MKKNYSMAQVIFLFASMIIFSFMAKAQPANDECANATPITQAADEASCVPISVNTVGATQSADTLDANCSTVSYDDDVWYQFTADSPNVVVKVTNKSSSFGVGLTMYAGSCGGTQTPECEFWANGDSLAFRGLSVGTTYFLRTFTAYDTAFGTYDLCIYAFTPPPGPANDDCANAISITAGLTKSSCTPVTVNTVGATQQANPQPSCAPTSSDDDVWYSFVAVDTRMTIWADNSTFTGGITEVGMAVFDGSCSGTQLACNVQTGGNGDSLLVTNLTVGNTYYLDVFSRYNTNQGTFQICVYGYGNPSPPVNDECAGVISITPAADLASCVNTMVNTTGATQSVPAATCGPNSSDDDVWYVFTANATSMNFSSSNYGAGITEVGFALYSGTCASVTELGCALTGTLVVPNLTVGNTYYLKTFTRYTAATGSYEICAYATPPPPANDECDNPVQLIVDPNPTPVTGDVTGATETMPADSCNGFASPLGNDVWFSFVATDADQIIQVQGNNDFDAIVFLMDDCFGNIISCADTGAAGSLEVINATGLSVGSTYYIRVYDWADLAGDKTFTISVTGPAGNVSIDESVFLSNFGIAPNPAAGKFILSGNFSTSGKFKVEVVNLLGQTIFSDDFDLSVRQMIDLSSQPEGMYVLKIKRGKAAINKKIVVSR